MELKEFGINLARIRINKNISAYELSLMIGKDASYVHKVENAKLNPSIKTIFEICRMLDIEPKVLFE